MISENRTYPTANNDNLPDESVRQLTVMNLEQLQVYRCQVALWVCLTDTGWRYGQYQQLPNYGILDGANRLVD